MENNTNPVELLQQFAEATLQNHLQELETRYSNEDLGSKELLQEGYSEHQKIFSKELDEKIESLRQQSKDDNHELNDVKERYLKKLTPDQAQKNS